MRVRYRSKLAISTAEFVICAPMIMAFFFIIPFLNDFVRAQQDLGIVTRNYAQNGAIPNATDYRTAFDRNYGDRDNNRVAFVAPEATGQSPSYRFISNSFGTITPTTTSLLNSVKDFGLGSFRLFPYDSLQKATITYTPTQLRERYANFLFRVISWLGNNTPLTAGKEAFDNGIFRNQVSQSYVRRNGGYHPNEYQYHTIASFFLAQRDVSVPWHSPAKRTKTGKLHSKDASFITECAMHFMANDKCERSGNWFAYTTRTVLVVRAVVAVVLAAFSGTSSTAAEKGLQEMGNIAMDEITDKIADTAKKKIEDTATEGIKNIVNSEQFYESTGIKNVQKRFVDDLNFGPKAIGNQFGGAFAP